MTLIQDLLAGQYLDKVYGTVSNHPYSSDGINCDNPSLYTAEAIALDSDYAIFASYRQFNKDSAVEPGLFHRYPGNSGDISIDELIGAATLSIPIAREIYYYGRAHWWVFQPQGGKFTWSSFMGRYVSILPYFKFRATGHMNMLDQLLWSIGCVVSPFSKYEETSGKLLMWVQITRLEGAFRLTDLAIRFWKWQMARMYRGGLQNVMQIYFGPAHPFSKWASKNF